MIAIARRWALLGLSFGSSLGSSLGLSLGLSTCVAVALLWVAPLWVAPAWAAPATDEGFRSQPPAAGQPKPVAAPPVQQFVLDHGLRVALVERYTTPTLTREPAPKNRLHRLAGCGR